METPLASALRAEVMSIGDEVLSGRILDSNAQWLSQRLEEQGIRVSYHSCYSDETDPLAEGFRRAIERADVVVATGGLGPTADDVTREALAAAANRPLLLFPEALEHVLAIFARRKREMPERNRLQAMLPAGATIVPNPEGTAPGMDLIVDRSGTAAREEATNHPSPPASPPRGASCRVFCLPGVPAEMRQMWHGTVAAAIDNWAARFGPRTLIRHKAIKCFGAGESRIEEMLPPGFLRQEEPRVGINASQTTVIMRIAGRGATEAECLRSMQPAIDVVRQRLGELVFGEDDDELESVVLRLLRSKRLSLATLECGLGEQGLGGLLANLLGNASSPPTDAAVPPASRAAIAPQIVRGGAYLGGLVAPSVAAAAKLLKIDLPGGDSLRLVMPCGSQPSSHGAIAGQEAAAVETPADVAEAAVEAAAVDALAAACRAHFAADYALAVGAFPVASERSGSPRTFRVALAGPGGLQTRDVLHAGHAAVLRVFAAKQVLDFARRTLLAR